MSLPRYGEYKDSEVASLGAIPAHWEPSALKRVIALVESGVSVNAIDEPAGSDALGVLKTSSVYSGEFNPGENKVVVAEDIERVACPVKAGALIVSRMNTPALVGAAGLVEEDADNLFLPDRLWQVHFFGAIPKFVHYWTAASSYRAQVQMACAGTSASMQNLSQDAFLRLVLPLPPQEEQAGIATFLDRETAKIDTLIAEQEKLIALLAEKRQATISHAVTHGLNPKAPTKDSGVAWLGAVPAHWSVGKIQSFARRESGHTPSRQRPEYWEDCTIPWFSLADVWQIREGNVQYVYKTKEKVSKLGIANSAARLLPAGTVMLSRTASIGYSAIMGCAMATTQDFINWVCGSLLKPEFLLYVLRGMRPEFDRLMMGSTHQTIYMPDVAKLMMTLPPLSEQEAIVVYVEQENVKVDNLRSAAERAIALLKERRSTLIAAAVTGQIDVRGVVASGASL